jgi:hypothetical protein
MATKVTVRIGGEADSTLWDATSQVPLFDDKSAPLLDAGQQINNGGGCQWQFRVEDRLGEIPKADLTKKLSSHNVVTVIEDAPGFDCWIGRGRIADKGIGRWLQKFGDARSFRVTVDDGNADLKGLALLEAWDRPAESGRARVLAALAAFCDGDPRLTTEIGTHLVAAGGEVTMPAKKYPASTELNEIFADCATVEGKIFGAVIHHSGGSHLCFLYIDEADHTTFASTLSITDDGPDYLTSFPPIWDQGDAAIESGGDNPVSHIVSRWGAGEDNYVVADGEAADMIEGYDYWAVPNNDSISVTVAQAQTRANAIANSRRTEHVTHQVSIQITADIVDEIGAGMSIDIKSAASMGGQYLGTTQTRRIAQCKFEQVSPKVAGVEGYYLAHLQLDRPQRILAQGKGLPPGPKPPVVGGTTTFYDLHWPGSVAETVSIYPSGTGVWPTGGDSSVSSTNGPDGNPGVVDSGSIIDTDAKSPPLPAAPGVTYRFTASAWTNCDGGTGVPLLVVRFLQADSSEISRHTIVPGVTAGDETWHTNTVDLVAPALTTSMEVRTGDSPTCTIRYDDVKIVSVDAGTGTPSLGGPGEGDTGTPGNYLPPDVVIEHGDLSGKGGTMHDASQDEFDSTGLTNTDAINVQEAIEDLDAAISGGGIAATIVDAKGDLIVASAADTVDNLGVGTNDHVLTAASGEALGVKWAQPDHGNLAGLSDDDHPQYVKDSEFGAKGRILIGTGSGTFDDLVAGTDDQVLTADSGETTGVKWADAPSGGASDLDDLTDVDLTTDAPADEEVLTYEASTSLWVPKPAASGFSNPMTDEGDIITGGTSGAAGRLGAGTEGQVLTVASDGTLEWTAPADGGGGSSPYDLDAVSLHGTYGDDFGGTSLDAKWTRRNIEVAEIAFEASHALIDISSGSADRQLGQSFTNTDEVEIVTVHKNVAMASDQAVGPMFLDASGTGIVVAYQGGGGRLRLLNLASFVYTSQAAEALVDSSNVSPWNNGARIWLSLMKVGSTYHARYSLDGKTWSRWVLFVTKTLTPTSVAWGRAYLNPVQHQVALDRFNVIDNKNVGNNLVRTPSSGTATYTASGSYSAGYDATKAADGTTSEGWAANTNSGSIWWNVAWSAGQTLNRVRIYDRPGSNSFGTGYIEFSDGSTVPFGQPLGGSSRLHPLRFATKTGITSMKIWSTGGRGGGNPGLGEVEAYLAS